MKLMVLILNKTEALEYLLEGLSAAGIGGATIIPSSGMAMTLSKMNSSFLSSSIRSMFSGEEDDNKTIISVIEDDQLDLARRVVYNTVGDLSQPNTGIMFTVPLDFVEGRRKKRRAEDRKDHKKGKEENGKKKVSDGTLKGEKDR
ncbi:hypothetical protein [Ruminococcus albus]|uniref:Nitrogen regulatory protein P-II n=1 Tax=Ruminococcus albus TaxID=1264 RepID=A0A1H7JRS5_RUMAL|nr:hypothetical protein [Ruminococcus albus]SEK77273.1 hypothetical protein SAMN05216469_105182 [Ruminococcus albus]